VAVGCAIGFAQPPPLQIFLTYEEHSISVFQEEGGFVQALPVDIHFQQHLLDVVLQR
jgi:hypothetical protein